MSENPQGTETTARDGESDAAPTLLQKAAGEFLGTFALIAVGAGSLAITGLSYIQVYPSGYGDTQSADEIAKASYSGGSFTALAFGLLIIGLGYTLARATGAHLNPVLSLAAAALGRISWVEAAIFAAAQVVAGLAAGLMLLIVAVGYDGFDAFTIPIGASGWGESSTDIAWWSALILEVVLTALLTLVFLGATDRRNPQRHLAPVAVGLAFTAFYIISIATVNGGLNPAKSIGTAAFSGSHALGALWVFVLGPVLGAALAVAAYLLLFGTDGDTAKGGGLAFGGSKKSPAGQPWGQQPGVVGGGYPPQGYDPAGSYQGYPSGEQQYQGATPGQATGQPASQEQPIIQDGWQWDPQSQQWIPAQQQGGWDPGGPGAGTNVRPPQ